jgi:hypothetical protein
MTLATPDAGVLETFQAIEDRFNEAMVSNDVARISECCERRCTAT